jgi:hypothetical protein
MDQVVKEYLRTNFQTAQFVTGIQERYGDGPQGYFSLPFRQYSPVGCGQTPLVTLSVNRGGDFRRPRRRSGNRLWAGAASRHPLLNIVHTRYRPKVKHLFGPSDIFSGVPQVIG